MYAHCVLHHHCAVQCMWRQTPLQGTSPFFVVLGSSPFVSKNIVDTSTKRTKTLWHYEVVLSVSTRTFTNIEGTVRSGKY